MTRITGFPPISDSNASALVLGSMPGVRSLEETQYYAQPRNVFWRIMGELFGAGPELPYQQRLNILVSHRVALWDVLQTCERPGSLDSSIRHSTAAPNDFASFFGDHGGIRFVFFNGVTASQIYQRKVIPGLDQKFAELPFAVMPSTSPAHAAMTLEQKFDKWSALADAVA